MPVVPYYGDLAGAVAEAVPPDLLAATSAFVAGYIQHGVTVEGEMGVMAYHHGLWMFPLVQLFNNLRVHMDAHDASSSGRCRPDAAFYIARALCGKVEAKATDADLGIAALELTAKLRPDVGPLFPAMQGSVPGFALGRTCVDLYAITPLRQATLLRQFRLTSARERVEFLGVVLQVGRWMAAVTGPSGECHLAHSVLTSTANGHEVLLDAHGLRKIHKADLTNVDLITTVYGAPEARNVERGRVLSNRILLISSVGIPVERAITRGLVTHLNVREQVRLALLQLHALGVAHCDVRLPNVFFLDGTVFLGDLEYCTAVEAAPPHARRRAGITTALELDNVQYAELCAALP